MKKINEIFYSIQGEGAYTGTPSIFVRFSGCNLNCSFCDTVHNDFILMSDDNIIEEIMKYPADHVVLTGGEPGLQITKELVLRIHVEAHKHVQVETNGTVPLPDNIDWVTCSPKENFRVMIDRIHELKVVYTGQDLNQYDMLLNDVIHPVPSVRYLQPCSGENIEEVIDIIKLNPKWKLSIQTHKLLNIR